MPPKRKAAATKAAGGKRAKRGAKAATEPEPEAATSSTSKEKQAMDALKTAEAGKKKGKAKCDAKFPYSGTGEVCVI